MKFKCRFRGDPPEDAWEYESLSSDPDTAPWEAAQLFAEWAYYGREMWEADNEWTDEQAIIVTAPDGEETAWEVTVEFEPTFSVTREK